MVSVVDTATSRRRRRLASMLDEADLRLLQALASVTN